MKKKKILINIFRNNLQNKIKNFGDRHLPEYKNKMRKMFPFLLLRDSLQHPMF